MTHEQIEQQDLIDRYLLEELPPELREAFEEHYIACSECVERLQSSKEWIAGVRDLCAQQADMRPASVLLPRRVWGLAALLALGILVVARRPSLQPRKMARQQAPSTMPIVELQTFRSARPGGATLAAAAASKPFALRLDLRGLDSFLAYSVYIVNDSGRRLWSADGIAREGGEWLEVTVEGAALAPGGYWVRLEGIRPGESPQLLREYSLVVGP